MMISQIEHPKVFSRGEWLAARKELLVKEKQLTRQRDEIDQQRRELPWVKVEKDYFFEGPQGQRTLADLFEDQSQLIVSHFMFGPGWKEGCVGCSFRSDHVDGALVHLEHHDVSFVTISRAPLTEIEDFKKRMGWRFLWLSSFGSDFNYDYQVSFTPEEIATGRVAYNYEVRDFVSEEASGLSVFYKNAGGEIFHTYSTFGRGDEMVDTTYMYLDLTPKGRNEQGPHYNWVTGCGTMTDTRLWALSMREGASWRSSIRIQRADAGMRAPEQKAVVELRPFVFGPGIRISCTGRHQQPRVRLSLRKAA